MDALRENMSKPQPLMGGDGANLTNDVHWVQGKHSNAYSSTYNSEWKNHPNFGWGGSNKNPPIFERLRTPEAIRSKNQPDFRQMQRHQE